MHGGDVQLLEGRKKVESIGTFQLIRAQIKIPIKNAISSFAINLLSSPSRGLQTERKAHTVV